MKELGRKDPSFGIKASPRGKMVSEEEVQKIMRGHNQVFGARHPSSRGSSPNGSPRGYASVAIKDEYSPVLKENRARLLWSVRGHSDSIASLEIVESPQALLSASYDHTVRLWGTDEDARGVRLGSLLQGIRGKMRHPKWNFHVDVVGLEHHEMNNIHGLMRDLASRRETMLATGGSRDVSPRGEGSIQAGNGGNGSQFGSPRSSKFDIGSDGDELNSEEEQDEDDQEGKKDNDTNDHKDGNNNLGTKSTSVSPPWKKPEINNDSKRVADASLGGLNDNGPGVSPMNNNAGSPARPSGVRRSSSMSIQPDVPDHPDDFDQASYEQFQLEWFKDHPRRGNSKKKKGNGEKKEKKSPSFSMSKGVRNPHRIIGKGSKRAAVSFDRAMKAASERRADSARTFASKNNGDDYYNNGDGSDDDEEESVESKALLRQLKMDRLRSRLAKYGFDEEGNDMHR